MAAGELVHPNLLWRSVMSQSRRLSLFVPLDVNFVWDDAVARCSLEAQLLYVRGLCISKQIGSDGMLTEKQVARLCHDMNGTAARACQDLLENDLWVARDFGYEIRSWGKHNRTSEEAERLSKIRAEAGRKGGLAKAKQVATSSGSKDVAEKRREEKRREEENLSLPSPSERGTTTAGKSKVKGTRVPVPFEVTPAMVEWAEREIPAFDWTRETPRFVDFWKAKPGANGVKLDWPATWRNWMRTATERAGR